MSVFGDNPVDVQQLLMEQGRIVHWRPRYTTLASAAYGILPQRVADPHQPTGIAVCPVCWNPTTQRPGSTVCTVCWGTKYTGGFAPTVALLAIVTTGTFTLYNQESGALAAASGVWCLTNPSDGVLLPQDLVVDPTNPTIRYLVGAEMPYPGYLDVPLLRRTQLLPEAPDSPWQLVPLT